ncbi:transcriptional regulator, TrmB [Ferroglobus placidus DSM 10642]|uniref:Transcriptional regulator, TrmB n=1 Tax=Ferroglobus placidus (strain DSM 10642 / AEDII12DO) TaxID=589924 RepID=D3RZL0_FERPA|nr:TrmB family transcriptional regulator [Ferroglobus placidus]ADC65923.1 transcriptional regulator, TrmB [Ferroglobus placidus DSM 10642]
MIELGEVVDKLKSLGLTSYEAKALVALLRLNEATAREVSENTGIPRTKVYEVLRRLAEKGFVEIQPGTPTVFRALEPLEVVDKIQQDVVNKMRELATLMKKINVEKKNEAHHVWVSKGRFAVESKLKEILDGVKKEVLLFLIDPQFKLDLPKSKVSKVLLYEKVALEIDSFKVIDKEKLKNADEFYRKFAKLIEGYVINNVEYKPKLLVIADDEKSLLIFGEGGRLVAISISIPLIVLLQKAMFESLWDNFTI